MTEHKSALRRVLAEMWGSASTYQGARLLSARPGLGALATLPPLGEETAEERAERLRVVIAEEKRSSCSAWLGALADAYRATPRREEKEAAFSLLCLSLGGFLGRLAAGRPVDPGALFVGLGRAAGAGWWIVGGIKEAARAERLRAERTAEHEEHFAEGWGEERFSSPSPQPHEERLDLKAALARLSPRDREVLALAALGYSASETAQALGIGERGAEQATLRARARLSTKGAESALLRARAQLTACYAARSALRRARKRAAQEHHEERFSSPPSPQHRGAARLALVPHPSAPCSAPTLKERALAALSSLPYEQWESLAKLDRALIVLARQGLTARQLGERLRIPHPRAALRRACERVLALGVCARPSAKSATG
jgi:DNA-binding CsgD family transcriptional regulator